MKYILILSTLAIIVLFSLQSKGELTGTTPSTTLTYALISDYRRSISLKPTVLSAHTCNIADKRVIDIQTKFNHELFLERAKGYDMGEILSENYTDEKTLLQAWLNSPTHKAVIDTDYRYGCLRCKDYKCVMIFEI